MSTILPPSLLEAVRRIAEGHSGTALADSATRISEAYRVATPSQQMIQGPADAAAYALSRMPATYAAVATVLTELQARAPKFAPEALLDAGTGPGTAGWAAAAAFPHMTQMTLLDHNREFLQLAAVLAEAQGRPDAELVQSDLQRLALDRRFDLVTCAYALTELSDDGAAAVTERLWAHCDGVLAIVEPGRPRDYQRLLVARERLIQLGGTLLAPCPHEQRCPLVAPDWCHFSVRLPRSREHMRMKGGTLGYEDEKFSYLIVARPDLGATAARARVIKPPVETKFSVTLPLCATDGLSDATVLKREGLAFKAAKKLEWGDEASEFLPS